VLLLWPQGRLGAGQGACGSAAMRSQAVTRAGLGPGGLEVEAALAAAAGQSGGGVQDAGRRVFGSALAKVPSRASKGVRFRSPFPEKSRRRELRRRDELLPHRAVSEKTRGKGKMRKIFIITSGMLVLALAGCGAASNSSSPPAVTNTASPVAVAGAPSSSPSPPSAISVWCEGAGGSDLQAVNSDLSQISTDANNDDVTAVAEDGEQLFHDASQAGINLPPLQNAHKLDYGLYMGWMLQAGYRLNIGDDTTADDDLQKAQQFKRIVMTVNNDCGS